MTTKPAVDRDSGDELFAADPLGDLVISLTLRREAELVALTEAGEPMQEELEVVRALLRSFRMPLSRVLH